MRRERVNLGRDLPVTGIPMTLSGWSYALADLLPWSHRQLLIISALMAIFDVSLLGILYRDLRLWIIQVITLAFGIGVVRHSSHQRGSRGSSQSSFRHDRFE